MSKVMLVLNEPDSCSECPCCHVFGFDSRDICSAIPRMPKTPLKGIHHDCPLKSVPEKIGVTEDVGSYQLGYVNGWNAILNKLLEKG